MNRYYLFLILSLFISQSILGQGFGRGDHFGFGKQNRIRELEKLKLIEVLNMDEDTSIRFFARRNEHMQNQRRLNEKREKLLTSIDDILENQSDTEKKELIKTRIKEILDVENELVSERANFLNSLTDLLTAEQIAKMLAFELRFRNEIRNLLKKRPRER